MDDTVNKARPLFHMTIGTTTGDDGGADLQKEIRLIKVALLYSDCATLYSTNTIFWNLFDQYRNMNDRQVLITLFEIFSEKNHSLKPLLEKFKNNNEQGQRILDEMSKELDVAIKRGREFINNVIDKTYDRMGVTSLEKAINSGLINVYPFKGRDNEIIDEYFDGLMNIIVSGETYPIFDNPTSSYIQEMMDIGFSEIATTAINRGKQAKLASYLFNRLPLFESASIDEILDIRKELERPLIGFRSALVDFANSIKNTAWDNNFSHDAEQVLISKVEPAIQEIEDTVKSNSLLLKLCIDLPLKNLTPGTLMTLLLDRLAVSKTVAVIAGLATTAGLTVLNSILDWRKNIRETEQNHLFFYYKAYTRLS
jgi:hypothetical protein